MKTKLALIFILSPLLVMFISLIFESWSIPEEVIFPALFYFTIIPPFIFSEYFLLSKTKNEFPKKLYLTFPISLAALALLIAEFFYGINVRFDYFDGWNGLLTFIIIVLVGGIGLIYGYIRLGLQHGFREFFQKIMTTFFTFIYESNTILLSFIWFIVLSATMKSIIF